MHSSVWLSGLSVWMSVCTSYVQFTEQLSDAGLHAKMRNDSFQGHRRPSPRLPPSPSSRLPRRRRRHQNLKKIATPSRIWTNGVCARVYLCVCVCVFVCVYASEPVLYIFLFVCHVCMFLCLSLYLPSCLHCVCTCLSLFVCVICLCLCLCLRTNSSNTL
jgi:hypothetical protein